MAAPQKITTCLWFDVKAEEAANFYVNTFKNSRINSVDRMPPNGPAPEGTVMTVSFELEGRQFLALNGGPMFNFTEAISLVVNCDSQEELDMLWERLTSDGGAPSKCGWLKDKFGLSWQIVPAVLPKLLASHGSEGAARVFQALWKMDKLDIKILEKAAAGNA